MRSNWFMFAAIVMLAGAVQAGNNVPEFLASRYAPEGGPHPPERWSASENVLWKTDLPGLGWASPIVWGDRVFLTTCASLGKDQQPRKGLYIEDLDANKYPKNTDTHQWKVYCLDLNTGSVRWEQVAHEGLPAKPHHIKNTLASETPCTDGERVYALFGNLGLFCYDMDGELVWKHMLEPRETQLGWGTSMSPIVHGDRVYYVNDNEEESYIAALDKRTGEVIWKTPRDEKTNYSTPYIWENDVRTELVLTGINWTRSYDLNGKELWKIKGHSILAIPTPFEHDGLLYLTSGHVLWGENRIFALRPGAAGDITPPSDKVDEAAAKDLQSVTTRPKKPTQLDPNEKLDEHIAWYQRFGPYHPTPIIVGENLYMLLDRGFMQAFNAKTGKPYYKEEKQRIPKGKAFTSSPWTYAGKIFCLNEDGVTFAISPGPDCEILFENPLTEEDMCMATPAIVGDKLLIRSSQRIYCIANTGGASTAAAGAE